MSEAQKTGLARSEEIVWSVMVLAALGSIAVMTHFAKAQGPVQSVQPDASELQVAAVVNSEQITRQQLSQECLRRYGAEVIESMVNRELIEAACQSQGITISQKDVTEEINNIAAKFGLSVDRWLVLLESERGVTPEQYGRDIIWPTLALRRLAAGEIQITQPELQKEFESEYGPKVIVRVISTSDPQKAQQLQAQAAAKPEGFGDLAKKHSEDPASASASGMIPPIRKHLGDAKVEQVAFALKQGEVSQVINAGSQYLILKCERHMEGTYVPEPQIAEVSKELSDRLRDRKMREASATLFARLQKASQVVNVYNDPQLQKQSPGVAATINGAPITMRELADECIRRHGKDVLEGEINRKILLQELTRLGRQVSEESLNEEIARAAESYGVLTKDGKPDVNRWLEMVTEQDGATVELYVRDAVWPTVALKGIVGNSVTVSEDDLRKGFEANYGERVEALAIVLTDHRQAQQVWDMARNNPTHEFFGQLATQYSTEPVSKENAGQIPPIRKYGGQETIEKEAFALKAGELSGIIAAAGDRYIILRCVGRTQPVVQDFNAVKGELYRDIQEKKLRLAMAKTFDHLVETAQIDNFLAGTSQSGKKATAPAANGAIPSALNPLRRNR